ncbi:prolyl oligopeptidase family serine peptidase [Salinibacter sp. 10B]|uniref:alpha/beta hydrolase n=1 Tax=Salinibacter sp. 10B TaxID=1923971 RepID=UPI0015E31350|nr:prolyl oligopeptidase family serine peptidase [Salinibacter sp. 10B]
MPGLSKTAVTDSLGTAYSLQYHRIPVDDAELQAAYIQHRDAMRTVLYFGGNGFRLCEHGLEITQALTAPIDVNLLLVDHRGYGKSTGMPTIERLKEDALAVYEYAIDTLETPPESLVVHGMSLGSFLAGHVADHRSTAGVVLESSVTTVEEWADSVVPWYYKPFVRIEIEGNLQGVGNKYTVRDLDEPLLLLVGSDDRQTKPMLSRKIYKESTLPEERKELHVLKGARHGTVIQHPRFARIYEQFLIRSATPLDTASHSATTVTQ